ncbi:hypothetical protein AVEN_41063-1 [Araneus ventricosus]|uniref:Uncharacterized protein n=1 Tax=Araneus ventricosus TaxID=182803 RepID=A0A4Y2CJY0_ARAVE|nr:hypothetical protein AVEN_41063-1 [Araneus ventricosus]
MFQIFLPQQSNPVAQVPKTMLFSTLQMLIQRPSHQRGTGSYCSHRAPFQEFQVTTSFNNTQPLKPNSTATAEFHHFPQEDSIKHPSALLFPTDSSTSVDISVNLTEALPTSRAQLKDTKQTRHKGLLVTFNSDQDKTIFKN